ncbi:MAG: methyltransferase domain-containing protein [Verrucomicrobiota bacterium]
MLSVEDTGPVAPANNSKGRSGSRSPLFFFREFLEKPKEVAYIFPSSPALETKIAKVSGLSEAKVVVELGPGTGGTTSALLRHMSPDARLLAIEINPKMADEVRNNVDDPRLIVHVGDAAKIGEALALHNLEGPQAVVSGIPFSCIPEDIGSAIQKSICECLSPGGRFVAYQLRDHVAKIGSTVFGDPKICWEWANFPPMRIFRFDKPAN